ncbi:ABC-2 type transport system ATP-binding protein [Kibdelosporangium phytohabitans]|nr:ABC-2 type transport system ATP-binding protein [Kibdelosporangium phytohabitans]
MIEVLNLSKHYGGTKTVDDLSFTVRAGQVTGFLGPCADRRPLLP